MVKSTDFIKKKIKWFKKIEIFQHKYSIRKNFSLKT